MTETNSGQRAGLPLGRSARSLPEQLADLLLAEVVAGRLRAGDRLKEETLAQQHAVSRATVRETLIMLAKLGYVERVPRFGARVAEFSPQDVNDLFELRAALLAVAAGRCARLGDTAQFAKLEGLVKRIEEMAADPETDAQAFASQSIRTQTFLIEMCGNRHLPAMYERLASIGAWQLIRGQATSFLTAEHRRESAFDWRELTKHLVKGDAKAAESAARRLLDHSASRVRKHLDEATRRDSM